MEGRIVSLRVEDFVTYRQLEFKCDKNLNVIIGPNGTGKSTIVCAMVLGLGGKPKFLGRANTLSSLIRGNCNAAKIEIELFNPNGRNYVITRKITDDSKSSWLLGGQQTTQKEIESVVSKLNIQVDNLCQFLPQDRVADFSKMNAQQLLEDTERCVGPPEMIEQHEKLKRLRAKHMEFERHLNNMNEEMNTKQQRNKRLAADVDSLAEKKNLLESIEKMKQKRAWVKYGVKRKKILDVKRDKEIAQNNLKKYESTYEPLERRISSMKNEVKKHERNLQTMDREMQRRISAVREMEDQIRDTEAKIKQNIQDCDSKLQAEEQRRVEVRNLEIQIDRLRNEIENMKNVSENDIHLELNNIIQEMNKKSAEKAKLRAIKENHQYQLENVYQQIQENEREQQKIQDVAKLRLQLIQRRDKHVYEAIMWLRENKHRFRCQIFEPMILEININDPKNAKYVEAMIPARDLFAFTCEDKRDMNEFLRILRDEKNLRINVVHSGLEQPALSSYKPNIDISHLRKYGFHSYLSEMFTAPDLIMRYLFRMYRLYNIPVGDASTYSYSEEVPECVSCFFSENNSFFVSKSKYSGNKTTRISELNSPYLLAISVNTQHLEQLERSLQILRDQKHREMKSLESIQTTMHRFDHELEALRSKRKELSEIVERKRTIQTRFAVKQSQLQKLENTKLDSLLEKQKCCKQNQELLLLSAQQVAKLVELLKTYVQSSTENKLVQLELNVMRQEVIKKENESRDMLQKKEQAQKLLADIDEVIKRHKAEASQLFELAKAITGGISPSDPQFTKFKQSFHFLPDTEEELDRDIQDSQAKADCLEAADDNMMTEYETRKKEISSLRGSMEKREQECKKLKEEMDSIREKWLAPLKMLINQINKKYSECFARLKCAGEVSLVTGENEDDYAQYGLKIKVKFRDGEQLQDLTQHLQSGGERAVSTAIYMIALQELIRVPFCVVDEINQGMDPTNERLIFELLVTTTKQTGTQYFLLTPKLVPSLVYDESITVHCVINGIGFPPRKSFNCSDIIKKKKELDSS